MTMPNSPTSRIREAQTESPNKARVLAELRGLQERHRLGIHVWEDGSGLSAAPKPQRNYFPEYTLGILSNARAQDSPAPFSTDRFALLSMSLLPATQSGCYLVPFLNQQKMAPGYLLNMSETHAHPPVVVQAAPYDLYSANDPWDKRPEIPPKEDRYSGHDALYAHYAHFNDPHELLQSLTTESGRAKALSVLDILGQDYCAMKPSQEDHHRVAMNEVICAAFKEHIAAIAMPCIKASNPKARLTGALCGLGHLEHQMNLPVVFYNLAGADCGKVTYLGQGKKELSDIAVRAIDALQRRYMGTPDWQRMISEYGDEVRRLLRLEITQRIEDQPQALAILNHKITESQQEVHR